MRKSSDRSSSKPLNGTFTVYYAGRLIILFIIDGQVGSYYPFIGLSEERKDAILGDRQVGDVGVVDPCEFQKYLIGLVYEFTNSTLRY